MGQLRWLTTRRHRMALAALAISASLVEALVKQGIIDRLGPEAILKEAKLYAQALCIGCSPEVEREHATPPQGRCA